VLVLGLRSTGLAGLPEVLDLLLQFDHLELTSDDQLLEALELRQPVLFSGLLVGDLLRGLHLFGHVTGGCKHAEHVSAGVPKERGVVQNLGERLLPVAAAQVSG
jgi:hypothetical protein